MIIVRKVEHFAGSRNAHIALCEEIRRTNRRVYVERILPLGYSPAILGNAQVGSFCDIDNVLCWNATKAMFYEMLEYIKQSEEQESDLRRQIRELYDATDRKVYEIAITESPTIQEES